MDDHSTDQTWAMMNEYAGGQRTRLYRNERNLGQNGNFARCLQLARGEWFLLLAADDMLVPEAVQTVKAVLQSRPDAVMWIHNHISSGLGLPPHLVTVHEQVHEYLAMEFAELLYLKGNIFGEISNHVIRRSAVLKVSCPFVDGGQSVDFRCWMRVAACNPDGRVIYWPEALAQVLEHDASRSAANLRSGEVYIDFFNLPVEMFDIRWRRSVLAYQFFRVLYCAVKFGWRLPSGKRSLPFQTALILLWHVCIPRREDGR